MSIKNLFNNYKNKQHNKVATIASSSVLLESVEYISAKQEEFDRFVPNIDFSSASNFAKFGSAEMYYETAFKRIYQEYPYDGTLAEKQEFENESSYLDRYVFDYLYPRTNGYVVFSNQGTAKTNASPAGGNYTNPTVKEYILIHGGPHTASSGMIGSTIHSKFEKSAVYDIPTRRGSSLEMTMASGSTIEFWMKKPAAMDVLREEIFDLHNGEASGSMYGRLKLYLTSSDQSLYMTLISGSDGFQDVRLSTGAFDGKWNHHAITLITSSVGTHVKVYKNNKLINSFVSGGISDIAPVNKGLIATIGASSRDDFSGNGGIGYNKLSASLDEFRFWKKERSHKEIDNCWFRPVGGGTNEKDPNVDLGVYYKFNEGTTTDSTYDATTLDYSGRMTDGMWVGYATGARSTGSAMVESGVTVREFQDPIIYSSHPTVSSSIANYKISGSLADIENTSMFYRLFPMWMQEEDSENSNQLKTLSHMIGSYFDTIWHQTKEVSRIKHHRYLSGSNKAYPFASNILYSRGMVFPNLFSSAEETEIFLNKDSNEIYEKNIEEVKNSLYHNINLGLLSTYKSKGTIKSFRNFFRSLGLNKEIVRLNMYADESTHILKNNYYNDTIAKKYLNFYTDLNMSATVYNMSSSNNTNTFISGVPAYSATTLEVNMLLPKKKHAYNDGYLETNFLTSSIAGFHTADSNLISWAAVDYDIKVYIFKEKKDSLLLEKESPRIKFAVVSKGLELSLTSSYIPEQYLNNKWNLAVKVRHDKYPYSNFVSGATGTDYTLEFYGVETEGRTKRNSFFVTASIDGTRLLTPDKRFYAGAHRQNFTGSVLERTDIKIGNLLYWNSYLPNYVIDEHSYDPENFGADDPEGPNSIAASNINVPKSETLVMHWSFDTITGSNAAGNMKVYDFSSGSKDSTKYGSISNTILRTHEGYGAFFANSNTDCVDETHLYVAKRRDINNLYTDDKVKIVDDQEEFFFSDNDVNDVVYSFEKSLYGAISAEMMNLFSTSMDFNNLIGRPSQKYHTDYNKLNLLKDAFFEKVENEPDIEKYLSFYKWIDDSISEAINQLIPAGVKFNDKIYDVIESHTLERNKYTQQTNLLVERSFTKEQFGGPMRGIKELLYNWQDGSAPTGSHDRQELSCVWWKDRRVRDTFHPASTANVREAIRTVKNNHSIASNALIHTKEDGTTYLGSTYAIRKLAKPYNFSMVQRQTIHGGVNYRTNKNKLLLMEAISPHGEKLSVPQNIITIGVGGGSGLEIIQDCDDPNTSATSVLSGKISTQKTFYSSQASLGKFAGDEYRETLKGQSILPFNFVEDTVHTGYNKQIKSFFDAEVVVTNIHPDITYYSNDIAMQGPFTETHVGGHQSRHVDLNTYSGNKSLTVTKYNSTTQATGSIQYTDIKSLTIGDTITIQDTDQSKVVATYGRFTDIKRDMIFTSTKGLIGIIEYHLDIKAEVRSTTPTIISLTQSAWGTDGNRTIATSTSNVTASGFLGGVNAGSTSNRTVNLDSTANRPEAWAIVTKTHGAVVDTDGAMGFVGPDYGGTYPNQIKPWAIRFRDEHVKRPVNIRNIQYSSTSQNVGNYRKGYELVTLNKSDQRRWFRDAYDSNLDMPASIKSVLPNSTHYMTLVGQDSFTGAKTGNVFIGGSNNRQPDGEVKVSTVAGKGEFEASCSYTAGTFSKASFSVTGAFSQLSATGSFKVMSPMYHGAADILTMPGPGNESKIKYKLSGSKDNEGAHHYVGIGDGSDAAFFNNLTASLFTNSQMTASYSSEAGVHSQGIAIKKRNVSFLSSSVATPSTLPTGQWTLSFWAHLDSGTGSGRYIYAEQSGTGSGDGRTVWIDSGGRLRLHLAYRRNNEGSYTNAYDQYYFNGFHEIGLSRPVHIIFTHSGSMNSTTQGHLYIDGKEQSAEAGWAVSAGGSGPTSTPQNQAEALFLLNTYGGVDRTLSNGGTSYVDEIIVLNTTASQAAVDLLYNGGLRLDFNRTVNTGCIIPSASIQQYWNFESETNVNDEGTVSCLGGKAMPLKISNVATALTLESGSTGAVYNEAPYALFRLTGALGIDHYSYPIQVPSTGAFNSFYDAYGIYGGGSFGALPGNYLSFGTAGSQKHFHFVQTASADSSPNYYIRQTGSSAQIWHALSSSLKAQFTGFGITKSDVGTTRTQFHLTASATGSALAQKSDVAEYGSSFTDHGHSYGANQSGLIDGHYIDIRSDPYTGERVALFADDDNDSSINPDFIFIQNTGSQAQIAHQISEAIKANSAIDTVNLDIINGVRVVFRLTSSLGSNYTLTRVGHSYGKMSNVAGGIKEQRAKDIVIEIPRTDLTSSTYEINTRFSAPGGPEVQTDGYLDVAGKSFSVHNALPFRNLTVRGSGSGEEGTIRMSDHIGRRRGLRSLLAIPMGRFGIDHQFGDYNAEGYATSGSFHKYHRNTWYKYEYSGDSIITGSRNDNAFIGSTLPRSDFQYSWIKNSISGSDWRRLQNINGYAPKSGIVSASLKAWQEDANVPAAGNSWTGTPISPPVEWIPAINFPTGSTIYLGSAI